MKGYSVALAFYVTLCLGALSVFIGGGYVAGLTYEISNFTHEFSPFLQANASDPEVRVAAVRSNNVFNNTTEEEGLAIAVVITLTKEPPRQGGGYLDLAAVLAHSIHTHIRGPKYRKVHPIALCGPNATTWSSETWKKLSVAGWETKKVELPIQLHEIESDFYREALPTSGCCGEAELVKLHAFALVDYDRVLLLDADSFLLQPIDELLEMRVDAIGTDDVYLGGNCINGGFLVLSPSRRVFSSMVGIVRKGDWRQGSAWGGTDIGYCYGGPTFQGIVPYYYQKLHQTPVVPGNEKWKAVNNCIYNNFALGKCFKDDKDYMQTKTPTAEIKLAHFTGGCPKPFLNGACNHGEQHCARLYDAWWLARYSLEQIRRVNITRRCENRRYSPLKIFSTADG